MSDLGGLLDRLEGRTIVGHKQSSCDFYRIFLDGGDDIILKDEGQGDYYHQSSFLYHSKIKGNANRLELGLVTQEELDLEEEEKHKVLLAKQREELPSKIALARVELARLEKLQENN